MSSTFLHSGRVERILQYRFFVLNVADLPPRALQECKAPPTACLCLENFSVGLGVEVIVGSPLISLFLVIRKRNK